VWRWCEDRSTRPGATVALDRLWTLARSWYDDRFELGWRRRTPAERQALLDAVGLTGPFWSLTP
jgi:hypothetical protein